MKKLLFLLIPIFALTACEEDEDPIMLNFSGIPLFDENGNPIGCYDGPCTDDWMASSLTDAEMDYLSFTDIINVPTSTGTPQIDDPRIFPVPLATSGDMRMLVRSTLPVKFKMALVSEDGVRRAFFATLVDDDTNLAFENAFFADVPRGETIRMYYAFYDANDIPIHTGHGDLGICTFDPPITNFDECFE